MESPKSNNNILGKENIPTNSPKKKSTADKLQSSSYTSNLSNWIIEKFFLLNGLIAVFILFLILGFLLREGMPAIREVGLLEFITGTRWMPSSPIEAGYGAAPFILSSLMVTVGALLIAVPWGIATAIFISEVAPKRMKEFLKPIIEILAIFPSVILGFIALVIVAPIVANVFGLSNGLTALTACIMLAIMSLPTIISITEDALTTVPKDYREAAIALGASRWETVKMVVIPAARSGILASVMLGFGRAVGETMTVLMAAGNALSMPLKDVWGVALPNFLVSVRTLTANIAIEASDVPWGSLHYSALFVVATILFVITFTVNLIADILIQRQQGAMRND